MDKKREKIIILTFDNITNLPKITLIPLPNTPSLFYGMPKTNFLSFFSLFVCASVHNKKYNLLVRSQKIKSYFTFLFLLFSEHISSTWIYRNQQENLQRYNFTRNLATSYTSGSKLCFGNLLVSNYLQDFALSWYQFD